jgi:hypothetical protein
LLKTEFKEDWIVGFKLTQQSNNIMHDVYEIVVDTPADLDSLPKYIGAGSQAIILKNESGSVEVRIKSPSGDWTIL